MEDKIKEYVDTDEVPQDNVDSKNEGGSTAESKETDKSLWYVAGFLIGLVILAIVLAII